MAQNRDRTFPAPLVVVVIGPESTGKTTLATTIAERYGAPLSLEFVRAFVERELRTPGPGDVESIARGQMAIEDLAGDAARDSESRVLVKDTDLVSTCVYARHYYGVCPGWIESAARERRGDLYLLLAPDVPWVADGAQRDRPHGRERLFQLFADELTTLSASTIVIRGAWDEREAAASGAIDVRLGG